MSLERKNLYTPMFSEFTANKLQAQGWDLQFLQGWDLNELNNKLNLGLDMNRSMLQRIASDKSKVSGVLVDLRRIKGFDLWTRRDHLDKQIKAELKQASIDDVKCVIGNVADYIELDHHLRLKGIDIFQGGYIQTKYLFGGIIKVVVGRSAGKIAVKGIPLCDSRALELRYFPFLMPSRGSKSPPWVREDGSIVYHSLAYIQVHYL